MWSRAGWRAPDHEVGAGAGLSTGWHGSWQGPWPGRWHGRRMRPWPPGPRRAGIAVVVAVIQVFGCRAADEIPVRDLDLAGYALLLAGPVALLWVRRWPPPVLGWTLAFAGIYALAGYPRGPFIAAAVVALFFTVLAGRRAAAWLVAWLAYAAYLVCGTLLAAPLGVHPAARPDLGDAVAIAVWLVVALVVAEAARVRAQHLGEIARYRAEQARLRDEQERRRASEERLRIARELHDVLGHHLSLINVQAGVGLHLMDGRPEQARDALTAIKAASAEALREVRAVLGVLRPEEEAAPREPAPGLDRLSELAADAGLPVSVRVRGIARPLPAEVDRAAYRIVREALTNVRRHAGSGATAAVTIGYDRGGVTVRVDDDGKPPPPDDGGTGSVGGVGIAGMRARAVALGGRLSAGPGPEGGFRVEAYLPAAVSGAGDWACPPGERDRKAGQP
ncbi:MAG TPA: histidine kinase [Pilimelia sp.]|nr:histidine kinase [Pilimelia sp.]